MCGILGLVNLNNKPADIDLIKNLTSKMAHRGPDGEGFWIEDNISISHRRLKIIDLTENGKQPMFSNSKRFILSFNGEIYNYQEIKNLLIKKGYRFKSETDSEVVVNAYQEWGNRCFSMFNGMFAVIIWDKKEKELIVARDRYGIKPLYCFSNEKISIFCSEIKPILDHPEVSVKINEYALDQYFTFQNNFSNETLFDGIHLIDKGTFLVYSLNDKKMKVKKFWDYNFQEDSSISKEESIIEVDRLFNIAVERQFMADVEIGSYLSGGMDSGAITAIAAKKFSNLKTFTIGFNLDSISGMELNFDERKKAKFLSDLYKTDHYELELYPHHIKNCMNHLIPTIENPVVGQSYPNYYAAQLAHKHVKVVFSGAGGDELFAGYPWRYKSSSNKNKTDYIEQYYKYWSRIFNQDDKKKCYRSDFFKNVKNNTFSTFEKAFDNLDFDGTTENFINKSLEFECRTFLQGLLLLEDKISMSFGLESRVPFLDNDLVDFAMKIPVNHKINDLSYKEKKKNNINNTTNDGKIVLRKVFEKYVTKEYSQGIKQGFSGPDGTWFRYDHDNYVRDMIYNKNSMMYNYFDYNAIVNRVNNHFSGSSNDRLLIWSLLNFEIWLKNFIKG